MKFYTYFWLRANAIPYYMGKGCGDRAYRNDNYRSVCRPKEDARILVQNWASEQEAFEMEKWWIAFFGRKDIGTGVLRNRTPGGDGLGSGKDHPSYGKPSWNKGKPLSPETYAKCAPTMFKKGRQAPRGAASPSFGKPAWNRGVPMTPEHRTKCRPSFWKPGEIFQAGVDTQFKKGSPCWCKGKKAPSISHAMLGNRNGKGNRGKNNLGFRLWVTNGESNKRVKPELLSIMLAAGWERGRA